MFAILEQVSRADTEVLSALWGRLASFLELHAAAEEEVFYPALLQAGQAWPHGGRPACRARRSTRSTTTTRSCPPGRGDCPRALI